MKHSNFKSRFVILLLGFLTIGISHAWGESKTWIWSSTSELGSNTQSTTSNPSGEKELKGTIDSESAAKTWNFSMTSSTGKYYLSNGTLGSKNNPCTAASLTTSAFSSYVIKNIKVTTHGYSSGTLTVKVGSSTYLNAVSFSSSSSQYKLSNDNGTAIGDIEITWTNSARSLTISRVEVVFEDAAPSYAITPKSNNDSWGTVELNGSTITASPKPGYRISTTTPYTVTPTGTATVEQDGNEFTVTPTANCTVQINFEQIPTHDAKFYVNNVQYGSTQTLAEGAAISLPTPPEAPDGCYEKTFYGWTASTTVDPSTAPDIISNPIMGASDVNYYAVFAESSGTSSKEQSINLSAFDGKGTSGGDGGGFTEIVDGFTFTTTSAYKSSSNQYLQIYKSSTLTISSDKTITKINFSGNSSSYPPSSFVLTSGGGEYSSSNSSGIYYGEWSGSAKSITFTASSSQVRIYTLKITYNDVSYSDFTTYCETPTKCEDPIISLAEGTYTEAQTVTLTRKTKDAIIYYTIDGTNPATSGTKQTYSSPITVNQDMTLKAVAVKEGLENSDVVSAAYVINYTVTFNANGHGTAPDALTPVKYNATISAPTEPSETGWNFGGWYKEQACTNVWTFASDQVTGNMTLYAQWSRKTTTITLSQEDATTKGTEQIVATWGLATPSVTIPVRKGHDFKGYFDAETEGTRYLNSNGNSVSGQNWDKEDLTAILYARWQAQEYTITYRDQNDGAFHGTWPDPDTHPKKHTYGVETQLVNPTRTGYTFDGWFGNSECKGVAITAIEGDAYTVSFNIYAKWTAKNYTVTFNKNSEEAGGSMDPQPFAFDEQKALTENKFTAPAHKHFAGWAKTSDGAVAYADGANYKLTSEGAELFAVWAYNQTTITLDKQGGTGGNTSVTATYGSAMPSAGAVPNKTGYDFNGYYTEGNGKGKQYYSSTNASVQNWYKDDATLTLYAYWTPKTITVTLNKGDHGQDNGSATFVFGTKNYKEFTSVEPTKGYTLDGYFTTASGGSMVLDAEGKLGGVLANWIDAEGNWIRSSDGELHAHYTPINYPVTWLVNGTEWAGKGGSTEAAYNSKIDAVPTTLPTTSECDDEKVFMGWTDDEITTPGAKPDVLFTKVADAPTITGETKYYAVFATATGGATNYTKLTDASALAAGDNLVVTGVKNETTYGMKAYTSGNNCGASSITIDDNTISELGDACELTLGGNSTNGWTLFDGTYYVYAAGTATSGKNHMKGKQTSDDACLWNITIDNSGSTTVSSVNNSKTPIMRYNSSSSLFSCYSSTGAANQSAVTLYHKPGTTYSAYATECEAEQPVITTQPIGGQYIEGNPIAPLSVVATPANKVTYQWQKSNNSTDGFTNIDGATNSSYTPDNTILGTTYYRCVVTNRDKSATSNPASIQITAQTTCATPSFAITGGGSAFIRETKVTMTTTTDGADIYYTLDGSTPSTTSEKYTEPVKITATTTVNAIAAKVNMTNSSMGSATFTKATLQSIAVKTAPKTEYTALETFDPTDLVITATYNYDLSEEVDYANHSSEFTFNPSTSTPLNVTDNTISITWEQKSTTQAITVNPIAMTAPEPSQTANDFTSVTIAWAAVANADHYEVAWNGGAYETATSPYTKTDLTYSSNYTYKVKVVGATNYGTAETAALQASTQTREVASIKDVVAPTKTYYVGDQVKNTDITCTVVYNNEDEEQGNPQFVGFASNPTSATTAALTDAQVGTTTIYVKSANTELTTTITVNAKAKHTYIDRVHENEDKVMMDSYTIPSLSNTTAMTEGTCEETHYVFKGWVAEANADAPSDDNLIAAGGSATAEADATFYAVWAERKDVTEDKTLKYGWESTDSKTGWTISGSTSSSARTGSKSGSVTGSGTSADWTNCIQTSSTITKPKSIKCYYSKEGNNTNSSSYWAIEIKPVSGSWTVVATGKTYNNVEKNTWYELSADLSSYSNVVVAINAKTNNSARLIDDVEFVYEETTQKDVDYITECVTRYELSFDANGGTGTTPETIKLKEGGKTALPDATLTKDLNDLTGWNTKANGQGTHYDFGAEYTMGGTDAKLYAEFTPWTLNNITLDASNATTEFYEDEYFMVDGLEVNASYTGANSGNHVVENISGWTTDHDQYLDTPFGHDYEGGVVTVSYQGKTATYNITITKLFNANFYVWGEYYATTAMDYYGYITMPVIPESDHLVYKDFVGWSKTQFGARGEKPEMIDDFYEPTADGETFYAVFGRASNYEEKTMTIDYSAFDDDWNSYDWYSWNVEDIYGAAFCTKENNSDNLQFTNKGEQHRDSTILTYSMLPGDITSITINRKSADKAWTAYVGKDYIGTEDKDLGEKTSTSSALSWTADEIGAGYRYFYLIETDDNKGAAYVSSFVIKYNEPNIYSWTTNWVEPDHVRTGLTYDQAGTICLPYAVKADDYKGASVWSIENKTGTSTMITSITLAKEVEDDGITKKDLEAGKPYIFFAEESEFQLFYSGEEYKLEENDGQTVFANGLFGNLDVNPIIINPTEYIPGTYLINQNKLMECGTNCNVPQYRAYVKADDIQYVVQAPPAAPRRVIGNPSGTPTNLNGLNGNGKAQKALIDGHIYILRDNKMYNAQGLFVK